MNLYVKMEKILYDVVRIMYLKLMILNVNEGLLWFCFYSCLGGDLWVFCDLLLLCYIILLIWGNLFERKERNLIKNLLVWYFCCFLCFLVLCLC